MKSKRDKRTLLESLFDLAKAPKFHVLIACLGLLWTGAIAQVIYYNDFNWHLPDSYGFEALADDWYSPSRIGGVPDNVSTVDLPESKDSTAIRFTYPGKTTQRMGWLMKLGRDYDDVYCSYYVRFEKGFDFVKGGKLPGLGGGQSNTGGRKPNGKDGWSARMMWKGGGTIIQYVYHPDQPGEYGHAFPWEVDGKHCRFVPGKWHHVETRVRINTPGKHDGIIQSWFDGQQSLNIKTMRFRTVDSFAVGTFLLSTFFGGSHSSYAATKTEHAYFDRFVISTSRMGPLVAGNELLRQIRGPAIPNARCDQVYGFDLSAMGGKPPYRWSLARGNLPQGLNLSASGRISGTPQRSGPFQFTLRVTDASGYYAEKRLRMSVYLPARIGGNADHSRLHTPKWSIQVAPAGIIRICTPRPGLFRLTVFDAQGRLLASQNKMIGASGWQDFALEGHASDFRGHGMRFFRVFGPQGERVFGRWVCRP